MNENLFTLCVLFATIALCERLCRSGAFKHFGTALLVIAITALWANIGLIPSSSDAPIVYDHIFTYIAPISIFLLLLECDLKAIRKVGSTLLTLFLFGSLATFAGVILGYFMLRENLEYENFAVLAGMFTGTYTGGGINFNAIALEFDVVKDGNLYAGAVAIDNIWTAIWMIITIAIPKLLYKSKGKLEIDSKINSSPTEIDPDLESINPFQISFLIGLSLASLMFSNWISSIFMSIDIRIPSILILTTLSIMFAQFPLMKEIKGGRVIGLVGLYLFLSVIGAYCDFSAMLSMGTLGIHLFLFVSIIMITHGLILFGIGSRIFKNKIDLIALASQANVGGSGSALALSKSLNRQDLLLPAILIGTLGNALGTYLGFLVVWILS